MDAQPCSPPVRAPGDPGPRRTMEVLAASDDVFESFFDQARIGLALADLEGRLLRVNRSYAQLLGEAPEDLVGEPVPHLPVPGTSAEQRYDGPDGQPRWVLQEATVVPGPDGRPAWLAVSAQDITARHRAEQELRSLTETLAERAVRDPLTGLANRVLLEERLRAVLSRDVRTGGSTGLLFLDLDGFKEVNDEHGHAVGDTVLTAVARRLTAAVRPADTVARLGGDEFVVLVEGTTQEDLSRLAERLSAAVREPLPTLDLDVGVSIGTALATAGDAEPAALLARSDAAMYAQKQARKADPQAGRGGSRASRERSVGPPRRAGGSPEPAHPGRTRSRRAGGSG
ncbi:MAG: diguanylate cyclase domain-containing protein [Mycobacteriales bacterium]